MECQCMLQQVANWYYSLPISESIGVGRIVHTCQIGHKSDAS